MDKIIKYGGHCYDSCGWQECSFRTKDSDGKSMCGLFKVKTKESKSLNICDRVYGLDYEGDFK